MKKMTTVLKFPDPNGGFEYLEYSHESTEYTTGYTRSHAGHGNVIVSIEVKRKSDLRQAINQLYSMGYEKVETFAHQ